MRHGTLSNDVQGRFLVVWEGLLATLEDDAARRRFRILDTAGARGRALAQWTTNRLSVAALTDVAYRQGIPVDLVTLLDEHYLPKLEKRAARDVLPISRVLVHTEASLDEYARATPFVVRVVHPYIDRPFLFGGKGIAVPSGSPWSMW